MEFTFNSLNLILPEPDSLIAQASTHVLFISAGDIDGRNIKGVSFNAVEDSELSGDMITLSATQGIKFSVDAVYNTTEMGIILDDNSVTLFTATTGFQETKSQNLSSNSTNHSFPELRRLVRQGML